jgi:hypothetical protein
LHKNGTPDKNIRKIVRFLCRSVFILLNDIQVEEVVTFIFQLLLISDEVNDPHLTESDRKKLVIKKLNPIIDRIGKNKLHSSDLLNNVLFRHIIKDAVPEYILLQELILGGVILGKHEFDIKRSKCGGIGKKVNHMKKSKKNKQSSRNRQSRRRNRH